MTMNDPMHFKVNINSSDSKLTLETLLEAKRQMLEQRRKSQQSAEFHLMLRIANQLKAEMTDYWPDDKEAHLAYLS